MDYVTMNNSRIITNGRFAMGARIAKLETKLQEKVTQIRLWNPRYTRFNIAYRCSL